MPKKIDVDYYCVCVKRNYEEQWRALSQHSTLTEAQDALEARRAYTGAFNYDNAELRVMSRQEAKEVFGEAWNYHPLALPNPRSLCAEQQKPPSKARAAS